MENLNSGCGSVSSIQRKLNTKGCCFLCLTVISNDPTETKPLVSLKTLQRYFRVSTSKEKKEGSSVIQNETAELPPPSEQENNINVELCESCTKVVGSFKEAFLSLEKAQMEVDYWSARIHHQISEGSNKPEQVQSYSKRMTGDPETLIQLVLVDKLRKEIAKKSLRKRVGVEANIYLHQLKRKPKKINLETAEDKMGQVHQLDEDTVSEADVSRHSTLSMHEDDEDNEVDAPPTVKEEKPDTSQPSIISTVELLSPVEPQNEMKLVHSSFAKMCVKDQKTGSYSCTSCNKMFKSKQTGKLHYEAIHLGKRYTCQVCKSQFSQQRYLKQHKKACNGKKRKSFSHSNIKKWNFNSETGKYACFVCSKEVGTKMGVYYHYESIHLEKKHKLCEICKIAVFSDPSNLRRHKITCEATLKMRLAKNYRQAGRSDDVF